MGNITWVVITNGSAVRILQLRGSKELEEVADWQHPESRMSGQELLEDRPGRVFESGNNQQRHSYESHTGSREQEKQRFAQEISHYLEKAFREHLFQRLYLVASPAFLGYLKADLPKSIASSVVAEIDKDYTHLSNEQLIEKLYITFGV